MSRSPGGASSMRSGCVTSKVPSAVEALRRWLRRRGSQPATLKHRPTDELHQLFALEGFLARLAASPHAERLVLEGGMLLAAHGERRPTRDVDMQARAVAGERDQVLNLVREIAATPVEDGIVFDTDTASAEIIATTTSTAACASP